MGGRDPPPRMRRGARARPTMDRDLPGGDARHYPHPEGPAMRRLAQSLVWPVIILAAAGLAAGCGSNVKGVVASLAPSRSISISPSGGGTPSASLAPTVSPSEAISPTPSPAAPTAAATPTAAVAPPAQATATQPATTAEPGSGLLWLWIVLAAVVLLGLILLVARRARHRSAAVAGWRSRVIDVYARGAALCDAISVAERPGGLAADDAQARWLDIQRRADDLAQALYALREAAPDEDSRGRVAATIASLQSVRSAMDAERVPGGAGAAQAEVVRSRVRFFEASLRALRSPGEPVP